MTDTTHGADPIKAFEDAIREAGMNPPKEIVPDGEIHRFAPNGNPKDDAGWYVLHADGEIPAGAFGDWRQDTHHKWSAKGRHEMTHAEREAYRERVAEQRRQREEERRQRQARARERAQEIWDRATPAGSDHPYLQKKGVPALKGLRQDGDRLVVKVHDGKTLHGLQFIDPHGEKKFLQDTAKDGCYCGFGKPVDVIILAEGYATAASIRQATEQPVAVAFDSGNLPKVAKALQKKLPNALILVAGDNDEHGKGQAKSQEAADAVGGQAIVPPGDGDDWNDVHQRDGLEAVREPFDAAIYGRAPIPAEDAAPGPAPEDYGAPIDDDPGGGPLDTFQGAPFRVLGYNRDTFYYYPYGAGQIIELPARSHKKENLIRLAPLQWWEREFPAKNGCDWSAATNAMFRAADAKGIFNPSSCRRGRGIWFDQGRAVFNLGDRLIVDGQEVDFRDVGTRFVYEAGEPLTAELHNPLKASEAVQLLEICQDIKWVRGISAHLLAGWIMIAPLSGALNWRPHIWITGPAHSGKAQPHSASVLTPRGWRKMGELCAGDYVTTPDNSYARILRVFPQGDQPTYRLTFGDGREVRATADHLWKVRIENSWRLRTTEQLRHILASTTKAAHALAIPMTEPVEIKKNRKLDLPVDAYVLGALLGDGYLGEKSGNKPDSVRLSATDPDIVEEVRSRLPDGAVQKTCRLHDYRFQHLSNYGKSARATIKDLRLLSCRAYDKFIPQEYLEAPVDARWELLQGLMDTDGSVEGGSLYFSTVSPQLATDVQMLVRSLGGSASVRTKATFYHHNGERREGQTAYVIGIRHPERGRLFRARAKVNFASKPYRYKDQLYLHIKSIEPDAMEECSCILIDHPDRLYVTDGFTVTHNSTVINDIVRRVLGALAFNFEGQSSESALRQRMEYDALPVVFDESEQNDEHSRKLIQSVINLARISSSGGFVYKGTQNQSGAKAYLARSCMCLSSVNLTLQHYQDETRFTPLSTAKIESRDEEQKALNEAHYQELSRKIVEVLTPEFSNRLFMRAIRLLPTILKNADVFGQAAASFLGNRRVGDQLGPMLAGAYALAKGREVTFDEAYQWVSEKDWSEHTPADAERNEEKLLNTIMQYPVRVQAGNGGVHDRTLGELVDAARDKDQGVPRDVAEQQLKRFGIRYQRQHLAESTIEGIYLSTSHTMLKRVLKDTPWGTNWREPLLQLEGAEKAATVIRFGPGAVTRAVWIPVTAFDTS